MKWAIALATIGVLTLVVWFTSKGDLQVTPEELVRRCREATPSWESYQEDIKGQIGAGPAAEWAGVPVQVQVDQGEVLVDFQLEAPWSAYDMALPILLRDSFGERFRHHDVERVGGYLRYHFRLPAEASAHTPGWVELRYPHGEKWVPLDTEGTWQGEVE